MLTSLQRLTSPKSAEPMSQSKSKGHQAAIELGKADDPVQKRQLENSLSLWEGLDFVLCRPSTDRTKPTDIREGNLLYSVYLFKC